MSVCDETEEYDLEKTDDQLSEFFRILIELAQIGAGKEHGAVTAGIEAGAAEHQMPSARVQTPEVAPPADEVAQVADRLRPALRPLDRVVNAVDDRQDCSVSCAVRHGSGPRVGQSSRGRQTALHLFIGKARRCESFRR
jgi:hypothetical protein